MRTLGWENRFWNIIAASRNKPYVLGEHDCFRLTCAVLEALTGVDRWPEFSGYATKREACATLARYGKSFESAGDWFFGVPSTDVRFAQIGDACCIETTDKEKHLGICVGADTAFLASSGLIYVPTISCLCAWRID